MFQVPVTFCYSFSNTMPDSIRANIMQEFAANGAKHLVLTSSLISQIMADANFPKKLKTEMADAGLTFVDAHAPFQGVYDPIYPDPAYRPQMIRRQQLCLQICQDMGVDTYTIHVGNDFHYPEIPLQKHIDNISDALEQILPAAEECGVTVGIENIWVRSNVSPILIALKKRFPTPTLGLCFDSGHAHLMEEGYKFEENAVNDLWRAVGCEPEWQQNILEEMLPDVINCHLHDNNGQWDYHWLPGQGTIDWKRIVSLLKKAPRLKNIQSEVELPGNKLPIRTVVEKFNELGGL